jgi:phage shock protein A
MDINTCMKLYEITSPLKTYIARVKLKNGATVTATERTESLTFARQLLQHKFGDGNVFSVSELSEHLNELEEGTQTLTPQQLQVKALADKAKQATEQKKQLQARQAMQKAQEKMRDANTYANKTNFK